MKIGQSGWVLWFIRLSQCLNDLYPIEWKWFQFCYFTSDVLMPPVRQKVVVQMSWTLSPTLGRQVEFEIPAFSLVQLSE